MKRFAALALATSLLFSLGGCHAFVVAGSVHPAPVSLSGFVTALSLTSIIEGGAFVTVTIVTFEQFGAFTNVTFCGNMIPQFPLNNFVTVNFTPAPTCATVVVVVIV